MSGKYTVQDILTQAKDSFQLTTYDHATDSNDESRLIRAIQRYTQKNMKPISTKGRKKFYSREQVEQILYSEKGLHSYFVKIAKEGGLREGLSVLKSNNEYEFQIVEEGEKSSLEFDATLTKLELELSDYLLLMEDDATNQEYLNIEELEFLSKKGIFPRENLTSSERESLFGLHLTKDFKQRTDKAIRASFQQRKMEVMIEALFYREFELDENLLLDDITQACAAEEVGIPEPKMLRSIDRLKDFRFYCKPIENDDDDFDEEEQK